MAFFQGNSGQCNTKTKTKCSKDIHICSIYEKYLVQGYQYEVSMCPITNTEIHRQRQGQSTFLLSDQPETASVSLTNNLFGWSRSPLLLSSPWIHLELLSCRSRKVSAKELLRCLCFVMNVWKGGGLSPRRTLTYHHQSYSPPQHPQTHKISRKFRSDKYVSAPPQLRAGANLESQCFSCTLWISTPNSYT